MSDVGLSIPLVHEIIAEQAADVLGSMPLDAWLDVMGSSAGATWLELLAARGAATPVGNAA